MRMAQAVLMIVVEWKFESKMLYCLLCYCIVLLPSKPNHAMIDTDDSQKSLPVIMIADADPNVRELAGIFLTQAGYQVAYALNGYEALDKARLEQPAMLLIDIVIPRLDGLALCRLLKGDPATENIKVMVFSELSSQEERARLAGADAFLSKPVEKTRLVDAVTKIVKPLRSTLS
jgi:CheY-like chemotaxis protein